MEGSRKIVIAVDDSEASDVAFRWTLHNVVRKSDVLVAFNSAPYVGIEFPDPDLASEYIVSSGASTVSAETAQKAVTEQSKALVSKYMSHCEELGITCEGEVVKGEPSSWIVDECKRLQADMVVLGCKESGLLKRTLIGSVGDNVLHNAHCPVIIVRPCQALYDTLATVAPKISRKVVIAVDDSKEAVQAVTWAVQNFCREADKVIFYHVHNSTLPTVTTAGTGEFGMEEVYLPTETTEQLEVQALTDSEKLVEKFMAYINQETKISCEGMVVTGQTESKVCEGLFALNADAVVVGAHGKGALARTFLGSVSDYLAHKSPCPLIVVKQRKDGSDGHDDAVQKRAL